jgi:muramoyltetrapeptide carboxypeptidase
MGTPYEPVFNGMLLYLDDYNERYDILDRWFTTLYVSNRLQETAGVIFGDFAGCGSRGNTNILPVEDLFGERLAQLRKLHMFGLPIGHTDNSLSIPLGIKAVFNSKRFTLESDS